MILMVSGHRVEKLSRYDLGVVRAALEDALDLIHLERGVHLGVSGMAGGVDLWFCQACLARGIPYRACVPFEGQELLMGDRDRLLRERLLAGAVSVKKVRNRHMVEACGGGLVVWDGNKGGTHNCFQQLLEAGRDIWWVIPGRKGVVKV